MRALLLSIALSIAGIATAAAQSHPGWWTFVAPDSKTLVGIHWQSVQDSLLGEQLRLQFKEPGPPFNPVMPTLPCLLQSRDLLISSPELVMGASGGCNAAELKSQATEQGWKHSAYKGFDLWAAPESAILQWNERVVLIGAVRDLRAVVDRSLEDKREYSPLLMSGAKLARESDFWVASAETKGETSSAYSAFAIAPGDDDATSLTPTNSIGTSIALQAESAKRATEIAAAIQRVNPSAQVAATGTMVTATARLAKSRPPLSTTAATSSAPPSVTTPAVVADRSVAGQPVSSPAPMASPAIAATQAPAASKVATSKPEASKPDASKVEPVNAEAVAAAPTKLAGPQVIRIYGLDEGTREIVLPPKEPIR